MSEKEMMRDVIESEPQEMATVLPTIAVVYAAAKAIEYGRTLAENDKPLDVSRKKITATRLDSVVKRYAPGAGDVLL